MRNYLDGVAPSIPACVLEIETSTDVTVNSISQRYDKTNKIECWVLSMSGAKVVELYERAGIRLFARNVRGYLGQQHPVNDAMKDTLQDEPDRFFYYNNGITIVSEGAEKKSHEGRDALYVKHPQIINGQQTTRTLAKHAAMAGNASVLVKVIAVKQQKADDTGFNSLLSSIVAGTNFQSPINQADLRSNDRVQVVLERSLRRLGYAYMRKREARSEERIRVGGKQYHRITKEELAKAVAACDLDSYIARSSTDKLFDDEMYREVFRSEDPNYYLPRYWLFKQVNRALPSKDRRRETRWLVMCWLWAKMSRFLKSLAPKNFCGKVSSRRKRCGRAAREGH